MLINPVISTFMTIFLDMIFHTFWYDFSYLLICFFHINVVIVEIKYNLKHKNTINNYTLPDLSAKSDAYRTLITFKKAVSQLENQQPAETPQQATTGLFTAPPPKKNHGHGHGHGRKQPLINTKKIASEIDFQTEKEKRRALHDYEQAQRAADQERWRMQHRNDDFDMWSYPQWGYFFAVMHIYQSVFWIFFSCLKLPYSPRSKLPFFNLNLKWFWGGRSIPYPVRVGGFRTFDLIMTAGMRAGDWTWHIIHVLVYHVQVYQSCFYPRKVYTLYFIFI